MRETNFIGGTPASPNKLRLHLVDNSFIDIWLSNREDYAYHWEHRRQSGRMYRWDNAPHHPEISTYPHHLHDGDEHTIVESYLDTTPEAALQEILNFVSQRVLS